MTLMTHTELLDEVYKNPNQGDLYVLISRQTTASLRQGNVDEFNKFLEELDPIKVSIQVCACILRNTYSMQHVFTPWNSLRQRIFDCEAIKNHESFRVIFRGLFNDIKPRSFFQYELDILLGIDQKFVRIQSA